MARPTIYTDELAAQICEGLRDGFAREVAAGQHVAVSTFYLWLNARPEFSEAVEKAEADFVAMAHRGILHADGGKDAQPWTRLAWLLERRRPDLYKLETGVKHSGAVSLGLGDLIRATRKPAPQSTGDAQAPPIDNIEEPI